MRPKYTKGEALSILNSVHDPLGLVLPITQAGRRLYSDLCADQGVHLEDELEEKYVFRVIQIAKQLRRVHECAVRRWIGGPEMTYNQIQREVEAHVFVYAWGGVGATAVYLRVPVSDQNVGHDTVTPILLFAKGELRKKYKSSNERAVYQLEQANALSLGLVALKETRQILPDVPGTLYVSCKDTVNRVDIMKQTKGCTTGFTTDKLTGWEETIRLMKLGTLIKELGNDRIHFVNCSENPALQACVGNDEYITIDYLKKCQEWWHGPKWLRG